MLIITLTTGPLAGSTLCGSVEDIDVLVTGLDAAGIGWFWGGGA